MANYDFHVLQPREFERLQRVLCYILKSVFVNGFANNYKIYV